MDTKNESLSTQNARHLPGRFAFLLISILLLVLFLAGWKHQDFIADLNVKQLRFNDSPSTPVSGMWTGEVSFASSATTGTLELIGVAATDQVFATFTSGNSSGVGVQSAALSADTVDLTLSGQPGATSTVSVLVVR